MRIEISVAKRQHGFLTFSMLSFFIVLIYINAHIPIRNRTQPDAAGRTNAHASIRTKYTHLYVIAHTPIRQPDYTLLYAALYATPGPAAALYRKLHSRLYGPGNIYKMHTHLYGFRRWAIQNPIIGGLEVFQ